MKNSNTNGLEWCGRCKAWKLYESDGRCRDCGKQILVRSEDAILAEMRSKYGVE